MELYTATGVTDTTWIYFLNTHVREKCECRRIHNGQVHLYKANKPCVNGISLCVCVLGGLCGGYAVK